MPRADSCFECLTNDALQASYRSGQVVHEFHNGHKHGNADPANEQTHGDDGNWAEELNQRVDSEDETLFTNVGDFSKSPRQVADPLRRFDQRQIPPRQEALFQQSFPAVAAGFGINVNLRD